MLFVDLHVLKQQLGLLLLKLVLLLLEVRRRAFWLFLLEGFLLHQPFPEHLCFLKP